MIGKFVLLALLLGGATASAHAEEIVVYGAGSLKAVMGRLAADFTKSTGVAVTGEFGPSGVMRERIERGDHVDLFASADIGHPLKLRAEGRASRVVMFTRNALCAVAAPRARLTTESFLDRLLDPAVRFGTSTPNADPGGDYTWAMFRLADKLRPGSFAVLDRKAQQIVGGPASPTTVNGKNPVIAAFAAGTIDVMIGYCSNARPLVKAMPDLQTVAVPSALATGPEYGLAVLKGAPATAADFALFILSPEGQAELAGAGFLPVALPSASPR